VGQAPVQLTASTADIFASERNYLMEIDTTEYFNSPQVRRTTLRQKGGLLQWTPEGNWARQHSVLLARQPRHDWPACRATYLEQCASFHIPQRQPERLEPIALLPVQADDAFVRTWKYRTATRQFKFLDDLKTILVLNGVYILRVFGRTINVNNTILYIYLPWDDPPYVGADLSISVYSTRLSRQPLELNNPHG
jgi:hypothetical protein